MKKSIRFLAAVSLILGVSGYASAATVCGNTGSACATPAATTQGAITLNSANILNIQCINSAGANGNDTTSNYYFAVSHTDLGSTVANNGINNSGNGLTVEGVFTTHPASATPGSTVTAGRVDGTKGGTSYYIYAQACPAGSADNSANCSSWAKVDASAVNTSAYPGSVFNNPTRPTDATLSSISLRTNVPAGDVSNVASIDNITVNDIITPAKSQSVNNIGFSGNPGPYTINDTLFTNGFKPNNKYTISAQVAYPWDNVPIAGPQTVPNAGGAYWTTPENPGTVSASAITHCSALITAQNSNVATPNPTYTEYSLCATGICATSARIGGTPLSSDPISATITGLVPGTTYTPNAKALVGNQDGTETNWNSSGVSSGSNFQTAGTTGLFPITNLQPTTATFNFPAGFDASGATSWQIIIAPAIANPPSGSGVPPTSINLTGLVPNTPYQVQIKINEASCNYTVPTAPTNFTTPAVPPTSFALTQVDPFTLHSTWLDGVNATSKYRVQYCTPDLSGTCQQVDTASGVLSQDLINLQPNTPYCAHALTLANAGGTNSAYSNSACASTLQNQSGITIAPNPWSMNAGDVKTFTATVIDQNGQKEANPVVTWSISGGGILQNKQPTGTIDFKAQTPGGPYILTGQVTIVGTVYTNVSTITVNAAGPFFSSGPVVSVNPDNKTGTVSAQGSDAALGATAISYNWTLVSGPAGASINVVPNNSTSAGNAAITFNKVGVYRISCTISDNFGSTTVNAPDVTVSPILSAITVTPNNVTLRVLQDQVFMANGTDQFNNPMSALTGVTWSTNGGSIDQTGAFSSQTLIGTAIRVTATKGSLSGSAVVNLVNFDVSSAYAYPVPYKANTGTGVIHFAGLGSQSTLHIYTTSGRRVFDISLNSNTYDWNIKNSSGESIASGVYFYVIESPEGKKNGKLIIIQ